MKQFYHAEFDGSQHKVLILTFDAPVRKLLLLASRSVYISIPYSNNTYSDKFNIPQNTPVTIDLQSANGGKGCTSLGVESGSSSQTTAHLYVSIVEYGSDGDNDWYK